MAEWLLTVWFTIPTDSKKKKKKKKEFSPYYFHETLEECIIEEEKFGSISVALPGVEFHAEAGCSPNPHFCTDDGCPEYMIPLTDTIRTKDE